MNNPATTQHKDDSQGRVMLLGIISDTHDQLKRTQRAVGMLKDAGVEALIHCGDLTGEPIVQTCSILPFWFVFGNNDDDMAFHLQQSARDYGAVCLDRCGLIEMAGKKIGVTHGHMATDVKRLLMEQPDYLLTGHSHLATDVQVGSTRRINPGALHRAPQYTVAMINLLDGELKQLIVT